MNKKALTVRLVVLIITFVVVLALCAFWLGSINGSFRFGLPVFSINSGSGNAKLVSEDTFNAATVQELEVDTASYDISVIRGGNDVTVKYYSNSSKSDDSVNISQNGGKLVIKHGESGLFGINTASGYIEVCVPENVTYDYSLNTASGDISLDAPAGNTRLIAVSGDVKCTSEAVSALEITTTSGDIYSTAKAPVTVISTTSGEVEYTGACADVSAKSVSGDINLSLDKGCVRCTTDTVSGEARISVAEPDYSVDFSTVSGDVSDMKDNRSSDGDTRYTVGGGSLKITSESVSGDLNIK